ncbi:hypothetical protein N869_03925 [Cellulomonas bogoriensis 69B4 = DSM 16987]|uniref:Uncharacterized protein n=1 Tax=Cellulomonas bogoriensis 69B4 = DSM 16987 TaxID=1386082 RepID=A0A0A0C2A5_9CELL|nr:hypothetical protein N869_03925 [Cellulomonas bogoriensis 69B4 = DSM 16987]
MALGIVLVAVGGAGPAAADEAPPPEFASPITIPGDLAYYSPEGFAGICPVPPGTPSYSTPFNGAFGYDWAFSADGAELAMDVRGGTEGTTRHLVVVDLEDCTWRDLGPTQRVVPPTEPGLGPDWVDLLHGIAWSPDGTELALGWEGDIVVVSAATGEHLRTITDNPDVEAYKPTWHPDGDVIAHTAAVSTGRAPSDTWRHIQVSPADGSGGAQTLVRDAADAQYSPDGERIAFRRVPPRNVHGTHQPAVYGHARAADGGDEVLLPEGLMASRQISWSPDGAYLAFDARVHTGGGVSESRTRCHLADLAGSIVWSSDPDLRACYLPAFRPRSTPVALPESGPVPDVAPLPPPRPINRNSTAVYLYRKLDPEAAASWENSGVQQLVWVSATELTVDDPVRWFLPEGLCGSGWGAHVGRLRGDDRTLAVFVDPTVDDPFPGEVTVREEEHREFDTMYDIPPCDDEEPAPGVEPEPITAVFVYERLDPDRAPSWGNSGMQRLVEIRDGHSWFRDLDPGALPDDVCGPGWAAQVDWLVGTERDQVPEVIDKKSGIGVLGWGTRVLQARHHSLGYLTDVPPCPDV